MAVFIAIILAVVRGGSIAAVIGGLSPAAWLSLVTFIVEMEPTVVAIFQAEAAELDQLVTDIRAKNASKSPHLATAQSWLANTPLTAVPQTPR